MMESTRQSPRHYMVPCRVIFGDFFHFQVRAISLLSGCWGTGSAHGTAPLRKYIISATAPLRPIACGIVAGCLVLFICPKTPHRKSGRIKASQWDQCGVAQSSSLDAEGAAAFGRQGAATRRLVVGGFHACFLLESVMSACMLSNNCRVPFSHPSVACCCKCARALAVFMRGRQACQTRFQIFPFCKPEIIRPPLLLIRLPSVYISQKRSRMASILPSLFANSETLRIRSQIMFVLQKSSGVNCRCLPLAAHPTSAATMPRRRPVACKLGPCVARCRIHPMEGRRKRLVGLAFTSANIPPRAAILASPRAVS